MNRMHIFVQGLIVLVISFFSCCKTNQTHSTFMPVSSSATSLSFLSLGDSYTIGESVPEPQRWSVQLADKLQKKGITVSNPDIIARTGWTTAELADAIQQSGNTKTYDLVSLLIGVNNQYRSQSLDRYRDELRDLLQTAIRYAHNNPKRVIVLSIPDWGVTPFAHDRNAEAIAHQIDAFNTVCKEETENAGATFFDITPLSRTAKGDASMVADDKLHFSGKMYGLWADQVLPEVEMLLK